MKLLSQRLLFVGLLLSALALPALAQTETKKPADDKSAPAIREQERNWKRAKQWTLAYLDAMPENAQGFKPTPEVRSFAEQMLHLAYWNFGLVEAIGGKANPYGKKQEELEKRTDMQTKAALRKVVEESYDNVLAAVAKLEAAQLLEPVKFFNSQTTRMNVLVIALDHQTHHRGQTTIYLRLKGVTPPPEP
jgi:uncharacterized damage-inducible protein DinB